MGAVEPEYEPEPEEGPAPPEERPPAEPPAEVRMARPTSSPALRQKGNGRQLDMARLLASRGPMRSADIAEALGTHQATILRNIQHPWFEKAGLGRFDPWRLSKAGEAAVTASTPPT